MDIYYEVWRDFLVAYKKKIVRKVRMAYYSVLNEEN